MQHPLEAIPKVRRRQVILILACVNVLIYIVFLLLDRSLRNPAAPYGIVSFELAGSLVKAQAMLLSWDKTALLNNAFGLGFDFLFIPVYALTLGLGTLMASTRRRGSWEVLGTWLGWAVFAAVGFDAIENITLFMQIQGDMSVMLPQLAAWCAAIKFLLIMVTAMYGLTGWLFPQK